MWNQCEIEVRPKWSRSELGLRPKRRFLWDRSEFEVRHEWNQNEIDVSNRSEMELRSMLNQCEFEVKPKWIRKASEVKSMWSRSEFDVRSKWHRSETEVKSKWNRSEIEARSKRSRSEHELESKWHRSEIEMRWRWKVKPEWNWRGIEVISAQHWIEVKPRIHLPPQASLSAFRLVLRYPNFWKFYWVIVNLHKFLVRVFDLPPVQNFRVSIKVCRLSDLSQSVLCINEWNIDKNTCT